MKRKENRYPTKWYARMLVYILFSFWVRRYRIRHRMPGEVKNLREPYLLISNHVGHWDPFIIGHFLPRFTHFVASDAAFKNRLAGFLLPRLGTIPKKKNVTDTKVVRDIIHVLKNGNNVGIFPEAVRNWAGSTLPIDPSIARLIKLMQVPVVASMSKGMNLFNPRWSKKIRLTKVEIEYKVLLTRDQIEQLSSDQIYNRVVKALDHDEVEYQRKKMHEVHSNKKAEYINHTTILYLSAPNVTLLIRSDQKMIASTAFLVAMLSPSIGIHSLK